MLTARERLVLCLIAQGYTDREIACLVGRSHVTVVHQMQAIYCELDALNRAHAVKLAWEQGILTQEVPS